MLLTTPAWFYLGLTLGSQMDARMNHKVGSELDLKIQQISDEQKLLREQNLKEEKDFEESVFEGYGPYGVAMLIECASDNNTRTVANVRMYFTRANGSLGTNGSVSFMFERKGVFKIDDTGKNLEDLELDLIDFGLEEINKDEDGTFIYTDFVDMGKMQKALEEKQIPILSTEKQRFPSTTVELNESQQAEINNLIEKFEDDDDVQAVYHNMK